MRTAIWNAGDYMPAYKFETWDLEEMVREAVALYRTTADRKGVKVYCNMVRPSKVFVSRIHLQHAINNLMHNAVKYSYAGLTDRERRVSILGRPYRLDYYEFTISNYGVGVQPEELERVFEPGYQSVLTRGEYRYGTGMGLTIAKDIIDKHDGMIFMESRHTGGGAYLTNVTIRVPRG